MANTGKVRIIGGEWRGRIIHFPDHEGLRPTADRVRETLFNWLAPTIRGAHCLDMFAGSGALGLEALSRGAAHCDFIERGRPPAQALITHLHQLGGTTRSNVIQTNAIEWSSETPYDLVFIDPPFDDDLWQAALCHLLEARLVAQGSQIYLEQSAREPLVNGVDAFEIRKDKRAGDVRYLLLEVK